MKNESENQKSNLGLYFLEAMCNAGVEKLSLYNLGSSFSLHVSHIFWIFDCQAVLAQCFNPSHGTRRYWWKLPLMGQVRLLAHEKWWLCQGDPTLQPLNRAPRSCHKNESLKSCWHSNEFCGIPHCKVEPRGWQSFLGHSLLRNAHNNDKCSWAYSV